MHSFSPEELTSLVMELNDEERLFIDVDPDVCQKLRYLSFQKQGYNNLFLSYINSTHEEANHLNLEKFLERVTQVYFDEHDTIKNEVVRLIGSELYLYILDRVNNRYYYIDTNRNQLVISLLGKKLVNPNSCGCGSCAV